MKSRIARVTEKGRVELLSEDVADPGPGQVLVRAVFSTLSPGTERALMAGLILPLPQTIGYSLAGIVEAVGSGVPGFQVGDAVVSTAAHAEYQCIDYRNLTPVPQGTALDQAAFFNLAHTAMYAIRRTHIQLGEPAVVLGQGLVGAITARLARLAGATPVIVTDIDATRLAIAKRLGADIAINSKESPDALVDAINSLGQGGVPVVFEATGQRAPLEEAINIVAERGRVMMMSTAKDAASPGITETLMMKGATLIGGYINSKPFALQRWDLEITDQWPPKIRPEASPYYHSDIWTSDADIRVILELIRHQRLDLEPLISHRFEVNDIPDAYQLVWRNDPSLIGGLICWGSKA